MKKGLQIILLSALSVLLLASLTLTLHANSKTYYIENFKLEDNVFIFTKTDKTVIKSEYDSKTSTIRIPEGKYIIEHNSNSDHHILLDGLSNVRINAENVEFVFTDIKTDVDGIKFHGCSNLSINGLTLSYQTLPYTQGVIDKVVDNKRIEFTVDKGYPSATVVTDNQNRIMAVVYDKNTLLQKESTYDLFGFVKQISNNKYEVSFDGNTTNMAKGDKIVIRKEANARTLISVLCENIKFEDITITSGGVGFFEDSGVGNNTYKNCIVMKGNKPDGASAVRLVSTPADAFHSTNVKLGPQIIGCNFANMGDDGINIHGRFVKVQSILSKNQIIVNSENWIKPLEVGDKINIVSPDGTPKGSTKTIKWIDQDSGESVFIIELDSISNITKGDRIYSLNRLGAGFKITDTKISNNRARGMIIKSHNGEISNCVIDGSSMEGILLDSEMTTGNWNEAGDPKNVIVKDIRITNTGYAHAGFPKIYVSKYAKDIVIPKEYDVAVFDSSKQFSGKQGQDGWQYLVADIDKSNYQKMPVFFVIGGVERWMIDNSYNNYTWGKIRSDSIQPGSEKDTIRAFTVPYDSELTINKQDLALVNSGSDGVKVCIKHNDSFVFNWTTINKNSTPLKIDKISFSVKKGDVIYFRVNKLESGNYDYLEWKIVIELVKK
jgi:hypothetical protein